MYYYLCKYLIKTNVTEYFNYLDTRSSKAQTDGSGTETVGRLIGLNCQRLCVNEKTGRRNERYKW